MMGQRNNYYLSWRPLVKQANPVGRAFGDDGFKQT